MLTFRKCTDADIPAVQQHVNALYDHDPNIAGLHPDIAITHNEFVTRPDKGALIVIDVDGAIAGYAILVHFWSNEYSNNIIEIDELYIDDPHRGGGVGKKFFAWLEKEYEKNSAGWSLQVAHSNPDAA